MKLVYVGDNRDRGNYGARGTSTALSQLLSKKHEIVGRIYGDYNSWGSHNKKVYFYNKVFPRFVYLMFQKTKKVQKLYYNLLCKFKKNAKITDYCDWVTKDPEKTLNRYLKCLPANENLKQFDLRRFDFDALVVNGEGFFIFSTPPWRETLVISMLMHWALKLGKKVYLVNTILSDDPNSPHNDVTITMLKNIMIKCKLIAVREWESFEYARNFFGDCNIKMVPDALYTWYTLINDEHKVSNGKYYIPHGLESDSFYTDYDFTKPYICVSGSSSSLIWKDRNMTIKAYTNLVNSIKERLGMNVFLVQACDGDDFLNEVGDFTNCAVVPLNMPILAAAKILANARVYISGRYHPAIMASSGGTPCVFMGSNSHKTRSLQHILKYENIYEFSAVPDNIEVNKIIKAAKNYITDGAALRNTIMVRLEELCKDATELVKLIN